MKSKKLILTTVFMLTLMLSAVTIANAEIKQGYCGSNVKWELDTYTGVLTISGNGAMTDFSSKPEWYSYRDYIRTVDINKGVTTIGDSAFIGCTNIENIIIPNTVTTIGRSAFYQCKNLISITLPNSVTSIGESAFYWCESLIGITIPNSITVISPYTFYYCTSLASITMHDGITSVGYSAFDGTAYINDVDNSEEDVVYIDKYLIKAASSISGDCKIKTGTKIICDGAFNGCTTLQNVTIPDSVENLGNNTFGYCSKLKTIVIGSGVTKIDPNAFYNCTSLTDVYYRGSKSDFESKLAVDYYQYFTRATKHYNYGISTKITHFDVNVKYQNLALVDFSAQALPDNCIIYIAAYKNDRLSQIKQISESDNGTYFIIDGDNKFKAFVWNSTDGLVPICENAEMTIQTDI